MQCSVIFSPESAVAVEVEVSALALVSAAVLLEAAALLPQAANDIIMPPAIRREIAFFMLSSLFYFIILQTLRSCNLWKNGYQPLTAPAEIPSSTFFCSKVKTISIGINERVRAARAVSQA